MKVKRYLVDDLPQAVQQIRNELGSDAVILNTKEIRTGGFLGMFRKKRVEVIAAVDESAKQQREPRPSAKPILRQQPASALPPENAARQTTAAATETPAPPLPASAVRQRYGGGAVGGFAAPTPQQTRVAQSRNDDDSAELQGAGEMDHPTFRASFDDALSRAVASAHAQHASDLTADQHASERNISETLKPQTAATAASAVAEPAAPLKFAAASPEPHAPLTGEPIVAEHRQWAAEPRLPNPQTQSNINQSPAVSPDSLHAGETAELLAELRAMKDLLRQQTAREPVGPRLPEPVLRISRVLAQQGVEPIYVEEFATTLSAQLRVKEEQANPDANAEQDALDEAHALLREWLAPARDPGISRDTRIVHFVGPTGVGKTTTIAKLGAEQALSRRRSVGFITADTYRIAAVDQLRTYADILNVPLEVVFSPSELARAYKKLEDRDLLLMDTAGRNYRNELYVSEVNSLLSPGEEAEKILVLSLTHKFQDMRQVSAQFVKYGVSRLLVTKMDETDSYGAILNLVKEFGFSIPYITFGQTVPDDIRSFDPDWLAGKLLEGAAADE